MVFFSHLFFLPIMNFDILNLSWKLFNFNCNFMLSLNEHLYRGHVRFVRSNFSRIIICNSVSKYQFETIVLCQCITFQIILISFWICWEIFVQNRLQMEHFGVYHKLHWGYFTVNHKVWRWFKPGRCRWITHSVKIVRDQLCFIRIWTHNLWVPIYTALSTTAITTWTRFLFYFK